jgi:ubiquitin C-terminal hydrolase
MYQPLGLYNMGNTCYINSFLQLLRILPPLNQALNDPRFLQQLETLKTPETWLLKEWKVLRDTLNQPDVAPNQVVHQLQLFVRGLREVARQKRMDDIATSHYQCDVCEMFQFFFSAPDKFLIDLDALWMGTLEKPQYASEIYSLQANNEHPGNLLSTTKEQYNILNLEIPVDLHLDQITLYHCLDDFTCGEILDGDNEWFDETTQKKRAIQKKIRFLSFPPVLFLALKRFSFDGQHKCNQLVNYPIDGLDVTHYLAPNPATTPLLYNLHGVCYHNGGLQSGHYTCSIRHPNTHQWLYYDDNMVVPISREETHKVVSPFAYCFLYVRQT